MGRSNEGPIVTAGWRNARTLGRGDSARPVGVRPARWRAGRLVFVGVLAGLLAHASAVAQRVPRHYALLIGINDYASPEVTDLRGAGNDITMLRRILLTRFGFAERDITTLTDRDATRARILAALGDLVRQAGPDDFVYFHFSGHGSQVADLNGDERETGDELDETILPYDARQARVPDIIDDEFEGAFAKLRSRNALIVFDSCHSGTITRTSTAVRPRFVSEDTRLDLYQPLAAGTREVVVVDALPHVLLTGAPAGQQALDGPIDGGWYGLFSYALAHGLDSLGPAATPVELHDATRRELVRIQEQLFTTAPDPQLEAPQAKLRLPIASAPGSAPPTDATRRTWLEVAVIDDSRALLRGGVDLNAQVGSLWGIYGPAETEFLFGNAAALGLVEQVRGRDAVLRLQARRDALPAGARAIPLAARPSPATIPVLIEAPAARRDRLQRAISAELSNVLFVGAADVPRFVVALEGTAWRVRDAGGLQTTLSFADSADDVVGRQLARVFATSATALALLSLENPATDIRLSVAVVSGDAGSGERAGRPVVRIRADGEPRSSRNSLILEIRADRNVYLTIVDVDTEGAVNLLFPNNYTRAGFLPAGLVPANTVARIPDSLSEDNRAGFHWDYSPPPGQDTVRVFATTDLATAETIRGLAREAGQRRDAFGELRSELAGRGLRGISVVPAGGGGGGVNTSAGANGRNDWAASSVVIDVRN